MSLWKTTRWLTHSEGNYCCLHWRSLGIKLKMAPGVNCWHLVITLKEHQSVLEFGLWVSEEDWLCCGQLWPLSKPRWVVRVTRPVGEDQDWECPEVKCGAGGSWNITREELCVTWMGWVACSQYPRSILGWRWDLSTRRWLGVIQG